LVGIKRIQEFPAEIEHNPLDLNKASQFLTPHLFVRLLARNSSCQQVDGRAVCLQIDKLFQH